MTRIAVVGGGLAGLVAARHLAEAGLDVELFEEEPAVGGRVRSVHEDGFTFDRGFQVLFTGYPAAQRELDYDALDLRAFTPGATIARPGERSVLSDPLRDPGSFTETVFNREIRLGDKLRTFTLQRELRRKDEDAVLDGPDTDITSYLADRGFSRDYVEHFAAPFYGGITLDRSLSSSSVVFEYTFKMLATGETVVPAAGMGAISAQLADRARDAGASLTLDATVSAVESDDDGDGVTLTVDGREASFDGAVVATDPKTAGELTGVDTPTEARGCVTQYFSLPEHVDLATDKRIVLNAADDRPNQVAPLTDVAPEYAPDGEQLLSATFLGDPDESDDELAAAVHDALASWYPARRFADLDLLRTERVPFSQFAQPPGFRRDLPAVDAPAGPVYLAGDYTEWSSINGALDSGKQAADAILTEIDRSA
ncbi:NAD(P)/FAD-dependent oxidoreductase [Halomarina ordinaria]|uniref:NAD(P)/FAD-dependent oxidoreductase n=1 Tax=Halomarina ordinaria TaxID=3033939 RepID=A0ABD5U7N6_9EURY|nr:NAD(P)/FAD-dependent oxidoreductase [Halomarina sp. PSRA2]